MEVEAEEDFDGDFEGEGFAYDGDDVADDDNEYGGDGDGDGDIYGDGDLPTMAAEASAPQAPGATPQRRPTAPFAPVAGANGVVRAPPPSDFVYGISPVLAALSAARRTPGTLFVQESLAPAVRRDASDVARALELAAALGVRTVRLDKGELNNMARNRPHQGLLLTVTPLPGNFLDALPPLPRVQRAADGDADAAAGAPPPVWLALDEIQDPQNLGALLRSAHFLGAAGVLVSFKNSAPLSAATSKASAGAARV